MIALGLLAVISVYYFVNESKRASINSTSSSNNLPSDKKNERKNPAFEDIDFAKKMILVDQQTMQMAGIALQKSSDAQVKNVSASIYANSLSDSKAYIALLEQWKESYLNLSDYPEVEGHDKYPTFPGMSHLVEIRELQGLQGDDFDKVYLKTMINHHEAVAEIQTEKASGGSTVKFIDILDVRKANLQKLEDQIVQMKQLQQVKGYNSRSNT